MRLWPYPAEVLRDSESETCSCWSPVCWVRKAKLVSSCLESEDDPAPILIMSLYDSEKIDMDMALWE